MANPAFKRSGEMEGEFGSMRSRHKAPAELAACTTAELIAMRDGLLEECLDLERHAAEAENEEGVDVPDPGPVRDRIDEIHHELAMRDLGERTGPGVSADKSRFAASGSRNTTSPDVVAQAAQKSFQILNAIEMRSRFMDELAQVARKEGRLDQAAAFTLNAQQLDMERVEVLRKLTALGASAPDRAD